MPDPTWQHLGISMRVRVTWAVEWWGDCSRNWMPSVRLKGSRESGGVVLDCGGNSGWIALGLVVSGVLESN